MYAGLLKANTYARYVNIVAVFFFASSVPMPADKHALMLCSAGALAANAVLHAYALATGRYLRTAYMLIFVDMATIIPAIYLTGFPASPFLLVLPVFLNIIYYLGMSKRMAYALGATVLVVFILAFLLWFRRTGGNAGWNPRDFPVFTVAMVGLQASIIFTLIHQSTYLPDPIVQELHKEELALARQRHQAELGTSVSMIAHEIRNPLTTIKLAVELVRNASGRRNRTAKDSTDRHLKSAASEIKRIEEMIESMLAFAREKQGRISIFPCNTDKLLGRAVDFIHMKYGRQIPMRLIMPTDEKAVVYCDRDAMQQILVNLLDNSIQARLPDRILKIEIRVIHHPGNAIITIMDDGRGIPKEVIPGLFNPFVSTKEGGTGLGLHIARQLVEKQGGTLDLHSTAGAGTTVVLKLPTTGKTGLRKKVT